MKSSLRIQSTLGLLFRPCATSASFSPSVTAPGLNAHARWAHKGTAADKQQTLIPKPTPFVPDVNTFLTLIGRDLKQYADKFPTWEALFTLTTDQLRELGLEPPRTRRYLLQWRQKFRDGKYGIGGDLKHVENGVAYLKVWEKEITPTTTWRKVINVPLDKDPQSVPKKEVLFAKGYKVKGVSTIVGPYALPVTKGVSKLQVTEGMWEHKRGRKVDGGERRRAEVRFKRGVAERKALREKMGFY
ncbi:IGR protein motif-domain-containing protein [Sordaria brevicollis]|uniref:Small ribosomal subunit protein mS41 n=1 Tax=Sordaria brevicollis TaxID=83679 RepID=A0AAE0UCQ8_SORBR|nr:IGR protein motif-domain-containing protein [Sordaria brevicollis]